MIFHVGEAYPKSLFAQSQWTTPPCQLQLAPSCQAEFVICDQTIDESFRDMKSLLGLEKLMNKRRDHMEKMVALLLIAYVIGLWLGETLRSSPFPENARKHNLYSGLFVLLKLKLTVSKQDFLPISSQALSSFSSLILPVRTNV